MENNNEVINAEKPVQPQKENNMPAIVSYLWWIGWIISYFALYKDSKTEFNAFHIRQSLGIHILSVAMIVIGTVLWYVPYVGGLLDWAIRILILVLMIVGLIGASKGETKPLPVVGELFQNWFKGIK